MEGSLKNKAIDYFSLKINHPIRIRLFRIVIYGFTFLYSCYLLLVSSNFFSVNSLIIPFKIDGSSGIFNLLMNNEIDKFYYLFFIAQIIFIGLYFFKKWERFSAIAIYFFTANLLNRVFLVAEGGNKLLLLFLFYLIFIEEEEGNHLDDSYSIFNRVVTNVFFLIIQLQICLVYLFSGLYKLYGAHWLNGKAIYYILSIDEFSHPWIKENLLSIGWLLKLLTYSVVVYQLAFPVLVWVKKIKPYILWIGVFFHLFISLAIGLFDFGIIMILAYVAFFPESWSRKFFGLKNFI
jgi:Vitamin K-dependent gamma-carboxylase